VTLFSSIYGDTDAWAINPAATVVIDLDKPTDRSSFALPSDTPSGEIPLINWAMEIPGESTERISIPVVYGTPAAEPEQRRPWFFRGTRRLDRHRAALLAARGGEGGSL
jgi:hypothetical protein